MTEPEPEPKPKHKFKPVRVALISLALCLMIPSTRHGAIAVLEYIGWSIVAIAVLVVLLAFMIKPEG